VVVAEPSTLGENVTLMLHEVDGAYGVPVVQVFAQMKPPVEQIGPP
jgi:hypothetical protein